MASLSLASSFQVAPESSILFVLNKMAAPSKRALGFMGVVGWGGLGVGFAVAALGHGKKFTFKRK